MLKRASEYIMAVHREKSFSKAAQKLYITQPSLSAVIQKEEAAHGVLFFDRSTNPIELTREGEYYIQAVEEIMEIDNRLKIAFARARKNQATSFRVGGATYFCSHILSQAVALFHREHPDCSIHIVEGNYSDLLQDVVRNNLDLCLTVEEVPTNLYQVTQTWEEMIILSVPAEFEVNRQLEGRQISHQDSMSGAYFREDYPTVDISAFRDVPFLMLRPGNDMYKRSLKICKQGGVEPNVVMILDQMLTSYHMSTWGAGVAFVRGDLIKYVEGTDRVRLYKIDSDSTKRTIKLVSKKSKVLPDMAEEFCQLLCQMNQPQCGDGAEQ